MNFISYMSSYYVSAFKDIDLIVLTRVLDLKYTYSEKREFTQDFVLRFEICFFFFFFSFFFFFFF